MLETQAIILSLEWYTFYSGIQTHLIQLLFSYTTNLLPIIFHTQTIYCQSYFIHKQFIANHIFIYNQFIAIIFSYTTNLLPIIYSYTTNLLHSYIIHNQFIAIIFNTQPIYCQPRKCSTFDRYKESIIRYNRCSTLKISIGFVTIKHNLKITKYQLVLQMNNITSKSIINCTHN